MKAFLAVGTLVLTAAPRLALACSPNLPAYVLDPEEQQLDGESPEKPRVIDYTVARAVEPLLVNDDPSDTCGSGAGSSARLLLRLAPTSDNRTPPEKMGYLVELVDGKPPGDLAFNSDRPEARWDDGTLDFYWREEDDDPFSFRLRVIAVDAGGNKSVASEPIWIRNEGVGCDAADGNGLAGLALVLVALAGRNR